MVLYWMDNCHRCLVIYEKHPNVLQYKETYCDRKDSLDRLCSLIPGDATLISMFRSEAGPTSCPFKGGPPYTFTYNKGSGECSAPPSIVDSCTDESRLLLRYQACPDVHGTESTTEELVCLATWKDGSTRYLVGKLFHSNAHSDEDRYRCFAYEKHASVGTKHVIYNLAQSGDATCNGLLSATEGSRTMKLMKVENHSTRCRYPSWVTEHHHWHTLDHRRSYHFSMKNATLKITEEGTPSGGESGENPAKGVTVEMRVVCHSMEATTEKQAMLVAHLTTGCQSGYVCMVFYKRDWHVIELQRSHTWTQIAEEACTSQNFNPAVLPYTTLITATPRSRQCPYLGRYSVSGLMGRHAAAQVGGVGAGTTPGEEGAPCSDHQQFQSLAVGCGSEDKMEFHSATSCSSVLVPRQLGGQWHQLPDSLPLESQVRGGATLLLHLHGHRSGGRSRDHSGGGGDGREGLPAASGERHRVLPPQPATLRDDVDLQPHCLRSECSPGYRTLFCLIDKCLKFHHVAHFHWKMKSSICFVYIYQRVNIPAIH